MAGMQCEADDELSRSSLPSEGSENNSLLNGSNNLDELPYNDLAEFVQLAEDHLALISEPARVEQGWQTIFDEGKESDYDWADEEWTSGEKLWKQLQAKAEVWHKANRASKGRAGMSPPTYDNIVRYLKTGDYPEEMEGDWQGRWVFRKKCEAYFLHTNGMLGYRNNGSRKYVLLEGEVEDVIQQIHLSLGHASFTTVMTVLGNNFFADCSLKPVVKRLSTCAVQNEDGVSRKDVSRVAVIVERVCQRLSVKFFLDGVQCTKSTKDCLQVSNKNGEVGMHLERYKEFCDFARRGYVPERYSKDADFRKSAAKYTWSAQGLVTVAGEKLVLNDSDAAGVIVQLHETYGHVSGLNLPGLFKKRFDCLGFQMFCYDLPHTCPFCMVRGKHKTVATPRELYSNAQYDVDVKWEGEKRIISIIPIGLDKKAVAEYVKSIEKKCGKKNKDKLPADEVSSTDENAVLYKKVLSIADVMLEKERSRLPTVRLSADTPLNWNVNSESDAENRLPPSSGSVRKAGKRKISFTRKDSPKVRSILNKSKSRRDLRVSWSANQSVREFDGNEPCSESTLSDMLVETGFADDAQLEEALTDFPETFNWDDLWSDEEESNANEESTADCQDSDAGPTHLADVNPAFVFEHDDDFSNDEMETDMGVPAAEPEKEQEETEKIVESPPEEAVPRAWQWSDMRPDQVYAFQEQMVLQDMRAAQAEEKRLQNELLQLKVDSAHIEIVEKAHSKSAEKTAVNMENAHGKSVLTSAANLVNQSKQVSSTQPEPAVPLYADPNLFEQPMTQQQSTNACSAPFTNPFDLATGRRPPGYTNVNGVMYPLNPGPIRDPYADVDPNEDFSTSQQAVQNENFDWQQYYQYNWNGFYAMPPVMSYATPTADSPVTPDSQLTADLTEAMHTVL